jgi:hypothetical protein
VLARVASHRRRVFEVGAGSCDVYRPARALGENKLQPREMLDAIPLARVHRCELFEQFLHLLERIPLLEVDRLLVRLRRRC